jgi:hypothetical protein
MVFQLAGVQPVTGIGNFPLTRGAQISYDYLLTRPVVLCIIVFMPEEHGKI